MSDFGDMADRISDFRKSWKEGTSETTVDAVRTMQSAVEVELSLNNSVARPELINSIDLETNPSPSDALITASVTTPEFAKYVEYGTGSRGRIRKEPNKEYYPAPDPMPPIEPIKTWAKAKSSVDESDAYAIQKTIGEQGQYPHPFMRPVWFDDRKGYENVVNENHKELKKQLRRL